MIDKKLKSTLSPVIDRIRSSHDGCEGWRLHIFREKGETAIYLADEQVLLEKIADIEAHRVIRSQRIRLLEDEAQWLRSQLNQILIDDVNRIVK